MKRAATGIVAISMFVAIALTGATSVSAVEPAAHFYACFFVGFGNGFYVNGRCTSPSAGGPFDHRYIVSTPETVESAGTSAFEIEATVSGQTVVVTCATETGTGTAVNPEPFKSANGEGETTLTFGSCAVSKLSACLPSKQIVTSKLHEVAEESKAFGLGIKFAPASGTTFAKVALGKECPIGEELVLQGSDFGIVNEENEFEFTNASGALTAGGKEAKLRGRLELEDESGDLVSVD